MQAGCFSVMLIDDQETKTKEFYWQRENCALSDWSDYELLFREPDQRHDLIGQSTFDLKTGAECEEVDFPKITTTIASILGILLFACTKEYRFLLN